VELAKPSTLRGTVAAQAFSGTRQLLAYAEDVNILGRSVHTIKKNTEAVVVTSKQIDPEVMLRKLGKWSCLETCMQDK
jgi:hypothetical protein